MTLTGTVSIITPCYNGARFLRATLESALQQTHPPLEVIVVDDGSTDDSAAIAESFGPPVRVIRQANQGESIARNVAIGESRGDYLLFLDADDLLHPSAIEEQLKAVTAVPGGVAVMGMVVFEEDPAKPSRVYVPAEKTFFPGIIEGCFGPPVSWLAPRAVIEEVGGFCGELRWFEDWELWCRVALTGAPLVSVPFVGAYYRQHRNSQTATNKDRDRTYGLACLMERLCTAMLEREDLLQAYGKELFWSCWTALHLAHVKGVSWHELEALCVAMKSLARRGPPEVTSTRFALLMRMLGVRWAETLRSLLVLGRNDTARELTWQRNLVADSKETVSGIRV